MEFTPAKSGIFDYPLLSWQGNPLPTLAQVTPPSTFFFF